METRTKKSDEIEIPDDPFRWVLKNELKEACERNPRFSLRSFAKRLGISPAALSALLNRKRRITDDMKLRLDLRLDLPAKELEKYLRAKPKADGPAEEATFNHLDLDRFSIIADWYHMAILELVDVQGFELSGPNVSRVLGISVSEANFAIERLFEQGLLYEENGKISSGRNSTLPLKGSSREAVRKFIRQSLQKSIDAVNTVPVELRDHTTITVATNPAQLDAAKKLIAKFRRDMNRLLNEVPVKTQVYQLQISLFPVSNIKGADRENS